MPWHSGAELRCKDKKPTNPTVISKPAGSALAILRDLLSSPNSQSHRLVSPMQLRCLKMLSRVYLELEGDKICSFEQQHPFTVVVWSRHSGLLLFSLTTSQFDRPTCIHEWPHNQGSSACPRWGRTVLSAHSRKADSSKSSR